MDHEAFLEAEGQEKRKAGGGAEGGEEQEKKRVKQKSRFDEAMDALIPQYLSIFKNGITKEQKWNRITSFLGSFYFNKDFRDDGFGWLGDYGYDWKPLSLIDGGDDELFATLTKRYFDPVYITEKDGPFWHGGNLWQFKSRSPECCFFITQNYDLAEAFSRKGQLERVSIKPGERVGPFYGPIDFLEVSREASSIDIVDLVLRDFTEPVDIDDLTQACRDANFVEYDVGFRFDIGDPIWTLILSEETRELLHDFLTNSDNEHEGNEILENLGVSRYNKGNYLPGEDWTIVGEDGSVGRIEEDEYMIIPEWYDKLIIESLQIPEREESGERDVDPVVNEFVDAYYSIFEPGVTPELKFERIAQLIERYDVSKATGRALKFIPQSERRQPTLAETIDDKYDAAITYGILESDDELTKHFPRNGQLSRFILEERLEKALAGGVPEDELARAVLPQEMKNIMTDEEFVSNELPRIVERMRLAMTYDFQPAETYAGVPMFDDFLDDPKKFDLALVEDQTEVIHPDDVCVGSFMDNDADIEPFGYTGDDGEMDLRWKFTVQVRGLDYVGPHPTFVTVGVSADYDEKRLFIRFIEVSNKGLGIGSKFIEFLYDRLAPRGIMIIPLQILKNARPFWDRLEKRGLIQYFYPDLGVVGDEYCDALVEGDERLDDLSESMAKLKVQVTNKLRLKRV